MEEIMLEKKKNKIKQIKKSIDQFVFMIAFSPIGGKISLFKKKKKK
jgi:hypothetical protein